MLSSARRSHSLTVKRLARRLAKFCAVGASGGVVNLTVFWLLYSRLRLHYVLASACAIEVAICSNYLLNNYWTFADRRH